MTIRKPLMLAASLLALGMVLPAQQSEPVPPEAPQPVRDAEQDKAAIGAEVDRLVQELGASEFTARDSAATALEKLGAAALPRLRTHLEHQDPEVRTRIRSLVDRLAPKDGEIVIPDDESGTDGNRPRSRLRRLPRRGQGTEPQDGVQDSPPAIDRFQDIGEYWRAMDEWMKKSLAGGKNFTFRFGPGMNGGTFIRPDGSGGFSFSRQNTVSEDGSSLTFTQTNDECTLEVKPSDGGEVQRYAAKDLEDFKTKHAEVYSRHEKSGVFSGSAVRVETFGPGFFGGGDPREDGSEPLMPGAGERANPFATLEELFRKNRELAEGFRQRSEFGPSLRRLGGPKPDASRLGIVVGSSDEKAVAGGNGLEVMSVEKSSLGESIGLQTGDWITAFDGVAMTDPQDLVDAFRKVPAGQAFKVSVRRNDVETILEGQKPETKAATPAPRKLRKL